VKSVLIVTEFFPNDLQPWLADSIEETCKRANVTIVAIGTGDSLLHQNTDKKKFMKFKVIYAPLSADMLFSAALSFRDFFRRLQVGALIRGFFKLKVLQTGISGLVKSFVLARVAGQGKFDLVHAHHEISAYEFVLFCKKLRIPLIVTFHGFPPAGVAELSKDKRHQLYSFASLVQVNTKFAAKQVQLLGCPLEKIVVIPQGVDTSLFKFSPQKPPPADSAIVILTVARLDRTKGHLHILRAVRELLNQGINIEYRIVGIGPELDNLSREVARLEIQSAVKFIGLLKGFALREEYSKAHIFILGSLRDPHGGGREETQGVAVQEAQASGKIVVATNTGGIPECIADGESGFLISDGDSDAIVKKIIDINRLRSEWGKWQSASRVFVEKNFQTSDLGKRQWELYKKVGCFDE
jgi:glycosyltransferase involved in cell wall biosynthesis